MQPAAVIFDMNGVIVNDEKVHQAAWRHFCQQRGFHITDQEYEQHVFGRTESDALAYLFDRQLSEAEVAKYAQERVTLAEKLFQAHMQLTPGLKKLLDDLKAAHYPMGVATNARRPYTNFIMDGLVLRSYFQAIVTAEDVRHGKPDPEIYLKVADELGVQPTQCLVFEDSPSGIRAAKDAKMVVIGLTTTHDREDLKLADYIREDFAELSVTELEAIAGKSA